MHSISTRSARPLTALVASATLACSFLAFASTSSAQSAPVAPGADSHAHQRPPMGRGMHGMHMMRELDRLKTSLRLDARQVALWDRAQQQMKPPGDMREQMKARHERMAAMLDDPNFDPRKLAADMDQMEAEHATRRRAVSDAWFAVYESLNPVQRGQVREFLRSQMSHGMRGHMGGHGMMRPGADTRSDARSASPAPK